MKGGRWRSGKELSINFVSKFDKDFQFIISLVKEKGEVTVLEPSLILLILELSFCSWKFNRVGSTIMDQ